MDPAAERKPVSFQGGNQRALEGLISLGAQRVIHVEEDPTVCIGNPPLPSEEGLNVAALVDSLADDDGEALAAPQPLAPIPVTTLASARVVNAQVATESQPPFEWTPCHCPLQTDPDGAPLLQCGASCQYGVHVSLRNPLLYWNELDRWMWWVHHAAAARPTAPQRAPPHRHKKWCLPRLSVVVTQPLGTSASLGGPPLVAMVSCGTLRAGHDSLHNQGLGGCCLRRLSRTSGATLEASFTSLLLQYTSFNCGNRPFHLFVTIAVSTPQGLQPLACLASPPIHVDARKRTKGERPDACAGDVRLVQRQRTQVEASAAPLGGSNGALSLGVDAIELLEATASVVVLVLRL